MREEKHEYDIPKVSQLSIFVGINYLITIHQSEIEPLVEMFQRCKSNEKERETSMGDSPGFLLHSILEALVSDLFHRLDNSRKGNLDGGNVTSIVIFQYSDLPRSPKPKFQTASRLRLDALTIDIGERLLNR
jgi:hypothetical protein